MKRSIHRTGAALLALICLISALSLTAFADDAPVILQDLGSTVTAAEGGSVTLAVEASGEDLEYQWYKNESPVAGAVGSSYTEQGFSASDHGARYFCYVQNPFGGVSSTVCTLTVVVRPTLTQDVAAANANAAPARIRNPAKELHEVKVA